MALTQEQILNVCIATFDAAPGAANLATLTTWADANPDATTADLAAALGELPEFAAQFDGMDTATKAATMASHFGLTAGSTGGDAAIAYFTQEIDNGTSDAAMLGAANDFLLGSDAATLTGFGLTDAATVLANKTTVAQYYSVTAAQSGATIADLQAIVADVDATAATVTTAESAVDAIAAAAAAAADAAAIADMNQLALTSTDGDSLVGTAGDDYIDGTTVGTLSDNDVIIDSTTTDNDLLKATVTSAGVKARLQDVENVNITGKYVTTGFDLTNTTGAKVLTLDTDLSGGTATVLAANSINAEKIVAGSNIGTLKVTSLSSGTRDTVTVDSGDANTTLTGNTGGADKYDVSLASGKTLTLATMDSAGDAVSVEAAGDFTLVSSTGGANLGVTINNNSTGAITVTEADTAQMAKTLTLSGNAITINATNSLAVDGLAATSSATDSTIKLTDTSTATTLGLNNAVVTTVDVAGDIANTNVVALTVNEGSIVALSKDSTTSFALTLDIDNASTATFGTGTLLLNANASQTTNALKTSTHVDTVLVKAGALADSATGNHQIVTINELSLNGATKTVVADGANDLTISTLTSTNTGTVALGTSDVVTATGMTGDLTISTFSQDAKVYGGSGNDSFTANVAKIFEIHAGAGDDIIDLSTIGAATVLGAAGSTLYGDAGNDTITTTTSGATTVDAGAGDDTINALAADTITTGAGADTVTSAVNVNYTVSDISTTDDTLVITGSATTASDLTNVTPTTGAYKISNSGGVADFTLTGSTTTDVSSFVQLGNATAAYVAASGLDVTAGAKDDHIAVAGANTIVTGAGSDTVIVGTGETTATVSDFVTGTDKLVLTGAATAGTIDLTSVTPSTATYTIDASHAITLTGHAETDLSSMVQLGDSTTAFNMGAAASVSTVTGSTFDDYIDATVTSTAAHTINFIDNGGFDTITNFTTTVDVLKFGGMTGINTGAGIDETAATAKVSDAVDGSVYILKGSTAIGGDTVDFSVLTTTVNNKTVDIHTQSVTDDVAGYINNVLGTTTGESYIVAVENGTSDTYFYHVDGDTAGITSSDISLIGQVDSVVTGTGDIA
jgi:hypothetical protein